MQNQLYQQPIPVRCDLISRWIDECTIKELECLFPPIVDDIFGISNKVGWDLLFVEFTTNPIDYENIFKFLHPNGPIFRLCYKLLSDPYIKYKFPLTFLPVKVRETIEDGSAPTFYIEKLEVDPRTRTPLNLSLNAFELYMFHFVYHVVNPQLKQSQYQDSRVFNSVYLRLAEEYLSVFLPCDCSTVQPELHNHFISQTTHRSVPQKPVRTSTLFRQDVLLKMLKQSPAANTLQTSPHVGIWRSELQVQLCIDFWLSSPNALHLWGYGPYSPYDSQSIYPDSFSNSSPLWTDSQLPTCEHLHVVRMLVKHLHYFANSLIEDSSAMDELKKAIIPSSQRKVYHFIRQTMQHWPLDASFKQILEIWLSYIQPWRYVDYQTRYYRPRGEISEVSSRWLPFIAENLLVYSVIFHQLIDRFKMIDLASSKNAYMLFRVTKVFSLPNLSELLKKVESSLLELDTQGYSKWVHSHLLDLEGPSFQYRPIFSPDSNIQGLLKLVKEAEYQAIVRLSEEQKKSDNMSFWERFFVGGGSDGKTLSERKNITLFLSASIKNLTQMFQIPEDSINNGSSLLESTPLSSRTPTSIYELSPEQMRSVKELSFEGDPDLQPIRSYENAFLVRTLYHLCLWINYNYSSQMQSLYTRRDVVGGIARQVLSGPQIVYHFDKRVSGQSPRVSTSLPPRLSLRVLANYHLLGYSALAVFLLTLYTGLSLTSVGALGLLLWLVVLSVRWLCGYAPVTPVFSVHDLSDSRPGYSFNG